MRTNPTSKPEIPQELLEDLRSSDLVVRWLDDAGKLREERVIRDYGSYGDGADILFQPLLAVRKEVPDNQEDPGDGSHPETTTIPFDRIVAIDADHTDNPYEEKALPVSRWVRDPRGELLRFTQ